MKVNVIRDDTTVLVGLRADDTMNVRSYDLDSRGDGISEKLKNEIKSVTGVIDVFCDRFDNYHALKQDGTVSFDEPFLNDFLAESNISVSDIDSPNVKMSFGHHYAIR